MLKQYVRDKNNNPIGVMLSVLVDDCIQYGYSICHKNDKYDKVKGMLIAFNRLNAKRMSAIPIKMESAFEDFIERSEKYWRKNRV